MARELHWRRGLIGALAGLLLLSPAGGAAYATAPAGRAAVPWRQVGPGWALALLILAFDVCGSHSSLLWLNPVTGKEQLLINTRTLAGVLGEVPFGQPVGGFGYDVFCAGVRRMGRP